MKKILVICLAILIQIVACKTEKTDTQLRVEALPYTNIAQTAYNQRDFAKSITYIDSSLAIFPGNKDLQYLRAKSYIILGNKEEGLKAWNSVIENYPNLYSAYAERAIYYLKEGEFDKARADIDKASSGLPNNLEILAEKGIIQQNQKKYKEAGITFGKIIQKDSLNANAYFYRGLSKKWGEENLEEARKDMEKAISINPNQYDYHDNLGFLLADLGLDQEAIKQFEICSELSTQSKNLELQGASLNNKAGIFLKQKKYAKALANLKESESIFPESPYTYRTRALVFIAQNNLTKACQELAKSQELGFTKIFGSEVDDLMAENCQ